MPRNPERLDPDWAREIAEECYGEVLAYCRRHAPAGHDPADLAQETFLRFVRAKGYAERGRPIAYLMRIARSACVDAARERRLETVALDFDIADVNRVEEETRLDATLDALPDDMREAVELRYGAGLRMNEVAHALGISRFSAKRRIDAALRLLAARLEEGDSDE